jgi:hypothetical protein
MKIIIETIPHEDHRYSTVGDWFYDPDGTLRIKVSKLSDARLEKLIAIHELVEVLTCELDGVTAKQVDDFDKAFEANRAEGNEDEPGDEPSAPYVKQHCLATGIERILAAAWGVEWKTYEQELCDLPEVPAKE